MEVHAVHFGETPLYKRLAKVLTYSIEKNSPKTPFILHRIPDILPKMERGFSGHDVINSLKTRFHNDIIQNAEDGKSLCLLDLDLAILGDLSPGGEGEFDLACTVRKQKARINSGVIFLHVSPKIKTWYQRWNDTVCKLMGDAQLLKRMKIKYSGINQSALGMMLEEPHDLILKELPCSIWNCTPVSYRDFTTETKVIHLLNQAKVLQQPQNQKGPSARIANIWLTLEKECGR